MATIEERLKELIAETLEVEQEKVISSAFLEEDFLVDSLALQELVLNVEQMFEIEIPDEEAVKIKTVQDAIDYVTTKVGK
ncbi:acyl carrier protein [Scytonema sp. NUACC21]